MYLLKNNELNTIKLGLRNSEGWKDTLKTFIHLDAPLSSEKNNIALIDKNVDKQNIITDNIIMLLVERLDKDKIVKSPKIVKIECFLIKKYSETSYLLPIIWEALNTRIKPITISVKTEKRIYLSSPDHHFIILALEFLINLFH